MFIKLNLMEPKMLISFENAHIQIIENSAKKVENNEKWLIFRATAESQDCL